MVSSVLPAMRQPRSIRRLSRETKADSNQARGGATRRRRRPGGQVKRDPGQATRPHDASIDATPSAVPGRASSVKPRDDRDGDQDDRGQHKHSIRPLHDRPPLATRSIAVFRSVDDPLTLRQAPRPPLPPRRSSIWRTSTHRGQSDGRSAPKHRRRRKGDRDAKEGCHPKTKEGERTHPRSRGTAVADCGAKRATRDGNEARYAADEPTQIWIATILGRHDLIVRSSGRQEGFARWPQTAGIGRSCIQRPSICFFMPTRSHE